MDITLIDTADLSEIDWQPLLDACKRLVETITEVVEKISAWLAEVWRNYMEAIYGKDIYFIQRRTWKARIKSALQKVRDIPRRVYWFFAHRRNN